LVLPGPRPLRFLVPSLLLLPWLAVSGQTSSEVDKAWADLADSRPRNVIRDLDGKQALPEARLALAAAWISDQPATDGNMRKAEGILNDLAQGQDETAAEAAYLCGRLYQLHYSTPDYAKAAQIYRALADRQPQSHWAQLGLVKLGMLEIYAPEGAAPADRLAAAEGLLPRIHEPALVRDLNLEIGLAGVVLRQPLGRVLPHLIAADRIGGLSSSSREDLIIQIGELSLRAGLLPQAREYFQRYQREYPIERRSYAVQMALNEANARLKAEAAR